MAKKTINISLYVSELLYDIQNKTYLTGRSRGNGNNHEEVANMQASDDEENGNQILRSVHNSFYTLCSKLSEYILDSQITNDDNVLDGADETTLETESTLNITLQMPCNYNQATVSAITGGCHQYIVNASIADWFTITNKADATDYVNLSAANLQQVREAVNKRIRPKYHNPNQ